ncbi:MAG TPA: multicopper oxidase family protein [Candidatus Gracilibacteria bacterium]|nr:multicopper oxidase family protein [Candidatus Gracilibacteria bacterium]
MKRSFIPGIPLVLLALTLSACQPQKQTPDENITQKQISESPAPQIVELKNGDSYDLNAEIIEHEINGRKVRMFGYNGTIPGPVIKVTQGSEIQLNFTNGIDIDQTIHSHGVRLDYRFDGVPDLSQAPVPPEGQFSYTIKFPDAGMYWYHPHIREDYAQELGLYGNYVVTPADPEQWSSVNREEYLFLDDILMDKKGIEGFSKDEISHALMGRFGNIFLVNGLTDYRRNVKKGEVVRIALTNSASTRTFSISIPGVKMKLVGLDGSEVNKEKFVDSIILSPSERAVLEVLFDREGEFQLVHDSPARTVALASFNVLPQTASEDHSEQFAQLDENDLTGGIENFEEQLSREPDKKVRLTVDAGMGMMGMDHGMMNMEDEGVGEDGIEWEDTMAMMNAMSTDRNVTWKIVDEETAKENMDIDWNFKKGALVKIRIFNDPDSDHPMQHPIHLHGQKFLVLSIDGVPNETLAWKDTALVPSGKTVDILLDASNPGKWMGHCHIAEHLQDGMMFPFNVE